MPDLEAMPGHQIRRLQQIAVAVFHRQVDPFGYELTPVQFAALDALSRHQGIDQATLAGVIAYDRTTITGVIDRLAAKELVERQISKKDRRARVLTLTEKGQKVLTELMPAVEKAQAVILQGLEGSEQEAFMALLNKATEAINDLSRAPRIPIEASAGDQG